MKAMQDALHKAGVVDETDIKRVEYQERLAEEWRWGRALDNLPGSVGRLVRQVLKKEPDRITLVTVEKWARYWWWLGSRAEAAFLNAIESGVMDPAIAAMIQTQEALDGPSDR